MYVGRPQILGMLGPPTLDGRVAYLLKHTTPPHMLYKFHCSRSSGLGVGRRSQKLLGNLGTHHCNRAWL